jgi:hypothetical protein
MGDAIKNEDPNVIKAHGHLESVLVNGEQLEAWAIQRRIFALTNRRILIAATSGRFIVIERGLFGGFKMNDFRWQDLDRVNISNGVFGADISFKASDNADLAIGKSYNRFLRYTGLRKDQTQAIYRIAQAQDQSWREKRRIREMEELRAKSGGINLGNFSGNQQPQSQSVPSEDSTTRLKKAKEMLDGKLITDSEYESIKARIISGL